MIGRVMSAAALAALLALGGCGEPRNGPAAAVRALYAPYIADTGNPPPVWDRPDAYTTSLRAATDRVLNYGIILDGPVIEFDPIVNGQDYEIKAVDVKVTSETGDSAQAVATFDNMGTATTVGYDLKNVDGVWLIDDIKPKEGSVRTLIDEALKPAGDAAAMEAPVRAIYARYTPGARPGPLTRYAALTDELKSLITNGPTLAFDPVVDFNDHKLGPVTYETVATSVVARFDNGIKPTLIVYDMTQEGGAWKIANIRAPGNWSLRDKMTPEPAPTP